MSNLMSAAVRIKQADLMLSLLAIIILTAGCAGSGYYGNGDPDSPPPEPIVNETEGGVILSVTPNYWPGTPRNLESYVTPVYVEITNYSGKTINITFEDFVLFDDLRTQYSPLKPITVAGIFGSSPRSVQVPAYPSYPRVSVGIGFGTGGYWGPGYWGRGWGYRGGYYGPYYNRIALFGYYPVYPAPVVYTRQVNTSDIIIEGLVPGNIYADSTLKGFVYFKRLPDETSSATLDISYTDWDTSKSHVLSFPFQVNVESY